MTSKELHMHLYQIDPLVYKHEVSDANNSSKKDSNRNNEENYQAKLVCWF